MNVKLFSFVKENKIPPKIEEALNAYLEAVVFKFATVVENRNSGKVTYSIFADEVKGKPSTTKAKVFRCSTAGETEKAVNEFLAGSVKMKFALSLHCANSALTTIFYE